MRQERNRSHPCSGWGCSERNAGLADDSCEVSSGHHPQTPALMLRLGVEKAGLKLDIQKAKIMASGPITSWQWRMPWHGETMETVRDFIWQGGSKITADGDCSHEIKRQLLFGRKAMTNLDSILKSRDIILPTKVCLVKSMVFPVVMYGNRGESWTIKRAEH